MFSLLALFFILGCSRVGEAPQPIYKVDPNLEIWINHFENEAKRFGKHIDIKSLRASFGDTKVLGDTTVGYCQDNEPPTIVIEQEYWDVITDLEREQLIFHELGHCVLKLNHDDSKVYRNGLWMPKTIMHPSMFDVFVYENNRDYYLQELFVK